MLQNLSSSCKHSGGGWRATWTLGLGAFLREDKLEAAWVPRAVGSRVSREGRSRADLSLERSGQPPSHRSQSSLRSAWCSPEVLHGPFFSSIFVRYARVPAL